MSANLVRIALLFAFLPSIAVAAECDPYAATARHEADLFTVNVPASWKETPVVQPGDSKPSAIYFGDTANLSDNGCGVLVMMVRLSNFPDPSLKGVFAEALKRAEIPNAQSPVSITIDGENALVSEMQNGDDKAVFIAAIHRDIVYHFIVNTSGTPQTSKALMINHLIEGIHFRDLAPANTRPASQPSAAPPADCGAAGPTRPFSFASISFEYPARWQVEPDAAAGAIEINSPQGTQDCGVVITWAPAGGQSPQELAAATLERMRPTASAFQIADGSSHPDIAGAPAWSFRFFATFRGRRMMGNVIAVREGATGYVFMLSAPQNLYSAVYPSMQKMLDSVRFAAARPAGAARPAAPARAAAPQLFRGPSFSFSYPGDWSITANLRDDDGYDLLRLEPASAGGEVIEVRFTRFDPNNRSAVDMARRIAYARAIQIGGFFADPKYPPSEQTPRGAILHYELAGNREHPGAEISSAAVISGGQFGHVLYVSNSQRARSPQAREMVLSSFTFRQTAPPTLAGRWAGQAVWYTFGSDGTLRVSLADNGPDGRGFYTVDGSHMEITYERLGHTFRNSCSYSLAETLLTLDCNGLVTRLERRATM